MNSTSSRPGLRRPDRHEHRILLSGCAECPHRLRRDADGRPGRDVDDLVVELALRAARHEEVDLFLNRVPVPAPVRVSLRRLPPAAEAFEGDGEVSEAETFPEESDLEVLRIHSDFSRLVRDVRDRNDGVLAHGISSLLAWSYAIGRDHLRGSRLPRPRRMVGLRTYKFRPLQPERAALPTGKPGR